MPWKFCCTQVWRAGQRVLHYQGIPNVLAICRKGRIRWMCQFSSLLPAHVNVFLKQQTHTKTTCISAPGAKAAGTWWSGNNAGAALHMQMMMKGVHCMYTFLLAASADSVTPYHNMFVLVSFCFTVVLRCLAVSWHSRITWWAMAKSKIQQIKIQRHNKQAILISAHPFQQRRPTSIFPKHPHKPAPHSHCMKSTRGNKRTLIYIHTYIYK